MIESIIPYIVNLINSISYAGITFLMFLESTAVPLPSELVMPFAGFLISQTKMTFAYVILFSTLGSLIGSLVSYTIGYYGGEKVIKKFGKYLLLEKEHLNKAEKWFERHGGKTIFFCRFVPGIRHVISIPAGVGKMNILRFSAFTILGAGIWNAFLAYAGFLLEKNWTLVHKYSGYIDIGLIVVLSILIIYYIRQVIKNCCRKN